MFSNDAWLNQVQEEIIDPARVIIDPHHHLWNVPELLYDLSALQADTGGVHNIVKTVFMECGSSYLTDGPEHMQCIGETDYVTQRAAQSRKAGGIEIAGIIAYADLSHPALDDILDAHLHA